MHWSICTETIFGANLLRIPIVLLKFQIVNIFFDFTSSKHYSKPLKQLNGKKINKKFFCIPTFDKSMTWKSRENFHRNSIEL